MDIVESKDRMGILSEMNNNILFLVNLGASILTYLAFFIPHGEKKLSYHLLYASHQFPLSDDLVDKVRVYFLGNEFNSLKTIVLCFANHGRSPIIPNDFVSPIEVTFDLDSTILMPKIVQWDSMSIDATFSHCKNKLIINPLLINKGESMTIKMYVMNSSSDIRLNYRIAGINYLKRSDYLLEYQKLKLMNFGYLLFSFGVFSFMFFSSVMLFMISMLGAIIYSKSIYELNKQMIKYKESFIPTAS